MERFKILIKSCEFRKQSDSLIRDRIILGIEDRSLKEKILWEDNIFVEKKKIYIYRYREGKTSSRDHPRARGKLKLRPTLFCKKPGGHQHNK